MPETEEPDGPLTEQYIVRQLGYLRVPAALRKKYGWLGKYPEPKVEAKIKRGVVRLIYEWKVKDLENIRRDNNGKRKD